MFRIAGVLVAALVVTSVARSAEIDDYFDPVSSDRYPGERTYFGGVRCCHGDDDDGSDRYAGEQTFFGGIPWSHIGDEDDYEDDCDLCNACPTFGPREQSDWYGGVDAVFLQRDRPENRALSIFDGTNQVLVETDDMEFDHEWGFRVNVGRRINECTAFEVSFLNLGSWNSDEQSVTPDPNNPHLDPYWGPSAAQPTDGFDDSAAHFFSYDSKLRDLEVNSRYFLNPDTSITFGFRYINVNENFVFFSQDTPSLSQWGVYSVGTSNDLYGLQLGLARQWCSGCRFSVGAYGKGGIFVNDIDTDNQLVNVGSGGLDRSERVDSNGTAFSTIVDVGLMGTYFVRDGVRLRAGYMFVYLNNLALAPEQLDNSPNQFALSGRVSDGGSMIYQGPTAGLDICW